MIALMELQWQPAITGLIMLLQEYYKNLNGVFMRASVRGLICHTANEAGFG
jgi:hypothetical protein